MQTEDSPVDRRVSAVTLTDGLDALVREAGETSALLGSMSDTDGALPVPGLTWTVAETAAHMVALLRQCVAFASGARDGAAERGAHSQAGSAAARMTLGNARDLECFDERRITALRQLLASAVDEYAAVITARRDGGPIETLFGQETPEAMTAALLGEQLVHGFDLARAVGRRWPIDSDAARLMLAGSAPFLADFVDADAIRDVSARIEVRIAGGARFTLVLDHGRAAVEPADGRCDAWIRAQPVPYLLVGFGRVSQWLPLLRGQILVGGRRPWIAARMSSYLTSI
jgi:hypothetical protein